MLKPISASFPAALRACDERYAHDTVAAKTTLQATRLRIAAMAALVALAGCHATPAATQNTLHLSEFYAEEDGCLKATFESDAPIPGGMAQYGRSGPWLVSLPVLDSDFLPLCKAAKP